MKAYIKLVSISHNEFKQYIESFSKEYNCDFNILKDTYWCVLPEKACKRLIELQNELKQLKKQIIVTIGGL